MVSTAKWSYNQLPNKTIHLKPDADIDAHEGQADEEVAELELIDAGWATGNPPRSGQRTHESVAGLRRPEAFCRRFSESHRFAGRYLTFTLTASLCSLVYCDKPLDIFEKKTVPFRVKDNFEEAFICRKTNYYLVEALTFSMENLWHFCSLINNFVEKLLC